MRFLGINASPQDSLEKIAREREELDLRIEILKDETQALTRALDTQTTTEVFLFDERGKLFYRGAIDDQYSLGAARPKPRKNYLRDALDAMLQGERASVSVTEAPGCLITVLPQTGN